MNGNVQIPRPASVGGDADTKARRTRGARRLAALLPIALVALLLAGCGGGSSSDDPTTTVAADAPPVTASDAQTPTFADVQSAVTGLYQAHPDIGAFVVQDVAYNATTRDKVLAVCKKGGAEKDAASNESVRVAGCAPLIFFFYEYGRQKSAPDSIDVARMLYWYAVTDIHGPFDPKASLAGLLRTWGIP